MTSPHARPPRYLLDHSALAQYWNEPTIRAQVDVLAAHGVLCAAAVTRDEGCYRARGSADFTFLTELYDRQFCWLAFDGDAEACAAEIRAALWDLGIGRAAPVADVLIAATALRHGAVVVHDDPDFLTIKHAVPRLEHIRVAPNVR